MELAFANDARVHSGTKETQSRILDNAAEASVCLRIRHQTRWSGGGGEFSPSSETRRVLEKARERLLISAARRDRSKQMESPSPNKRKPNESCCPGPVLVVGGMNQALGADADRQRSSPCGTFVFPHGGDAKDALAMLKTLHLCERMSDFFGGFGGRAEHQGTSRNQRSLRPNYLLESSDGVF